MLFQLNNTSQPLNLDKHRYQFAIDFYIPFVESSTKWKFDKVADNILIKSVDM